MCLIMPNGVDAQIVSDDISPPTEVSTRVGENRNMACAFVAKQSFLSAFFHA